MNKKAYLKPEVEVVLLQQRVQILAGSGDVTSVSGEDFEYEGPGGDIPAMGREFFPDLDIPLGM